MDLFELLGKVVIDTSGADAALDGVSNRGQQTQSKMSQAFSAVGHGAAVVGQAVATGLAVGGAAMAGLTVKALNLSGELEQNMGGSAQVFGEHAGKMQETAKSAFSNMGLSTNDFLATANKMGALFQGAGFDVEESMNLSSSAMQRAADVASIMGIDTSAAMEAIAGAAKGNFTMMDNLGVAMNDTSLQAYALEKGIKKSTQEMTQQEKIGLAMEMFMDKTAYAAGNYARENETLAGSLGTAKAALTNFLDGSGDVSGLVNAFSNAANVIVESLGEIAPRLVSGITDIINQIMPMLPPLLNQLLPVIIEGAVSLINGLVAAFPSIVTALMGALPALIEGVTQIINALIEALPALMEAFVAALPTLIPMLVTGLVSMIVTLCTMMPQIIQPIIDYLPEIIISVVNALLTNLPALIQGVVTLVDGLLIALPQIFAAISTAVALLIYDWITALGEYLAPLADVFASAWGTVKTTTSTVWEGIKSVISTMWENIKTSVGEAINAVATTISGVWDSIKTTASTAWASVKVAIDTVWNGIQTGIGTAVNVVSTIISGVWTAIKTTTTTAWNGIKTGIDTVWNGIKTGVGSAINTVQTIITGVWNGIKSTTTTVWNGLKTTISSVMSGVRTAVVTAVNVAKGAFEGISDFISNVFAGDWSSAWEGIKSTFTGLWDGISEVGSAIVEGVWDGIGSKVDWIIEKIGGFCDSVWTKMKNFFGIHSPSTLMRDSIGKNLADGVAEGIDANSAKTAKAAERMGNTVLEAAKKTLAKKKETTDLMLADEVAYWAEIVKRTKEGTNARIAAEKQYAEVKASLDEKLAAAEADYQKAIDATIEKINQRSAEILGAFKLFEAWQRGEHKNADELINALETQVDALDEYQGEMQELGEKIGDTDLFEAVQAMGLESLEQVKAINSMTEEQLNKYVELYNQRKQIADELAKSELADENATAIKNAYDEFSKRCDELGVEITEATNQMAANVDTAFATIVESVGVSMTDVTSSVTNAMNDVPNSFGDAMTSALDLVTSTLDKMKSAFESFEPKMKMPHFSITGELDVENRTVPEVSVEWYKKAMDNAMLLNKPTIFGAADGKLLGAGEAGTEVVSGANTLMNMIGSAVEQKTAAQMAPVLSVLESLLNIISDGNQELLQAVLAGQKIVVDGREFGRTVRQYA